MARLWTGGAEWADATAEGIGGNNADIQSVTVRSGAFAWRFNTASRSSSLSFTGTLGVGYYGRAYIRITTAGAAAFEVVGLYQAGGPGYWIRLNTDNTLQLVFESTPGGAPTNIGSASSAFSTGIWYRVELFAQIGSGSSDDSAEFKLDGVTIANENNQTRSTAALGRFDVGDAASHASGHDIYFDDGALNDSTGSNQNSWPGEGKIVLLKPVTDNAIGAGWTLGTGTATGGAAHTAVANTPPLGVADLAAGSDTKQVRNATSNANVNVDENMTDYTTAGLSEYDRVMVVDPIVATAAPVSTSAKQGTVGIVSNPAIANIALAAGGTSGAFWSGVAAGTYPTGWKISHGTITYNPAVTKGTAPVMRVTQVTSSTRIAMICAMGIYVEYQYQPPKYSYVHSEAKNRASSW